MGDVVPPATRVRGFVALSSLVAVRAEKKNFSGKEREVANFIVASVGRLIKPARRAPAVEVAPPPPRRRSSGSDTNPGWLSRHSSSRSFHQTKPYEPYIDLSPLELSRRH
jgi:hypothetical protein